MSGLLKLGIQQKMTQSLKMTPEMQLAVKLLQMNSVELKEQINEIVESNPMVEIDESKNNGSEISLDNITENAVTNPVSNQDFSIDWEKYISDTDNSEYSSVNTASVSEEDEENTYENYVTKKEDLRDFLTQQFTEENLNPTESKIGEYLIGLIDRNGYLRYSDEQLAEQLKIDLKTIKKVRSVIQSMEPVGVGAYDLRECLLIQALDEGYNNDAVTTIISNYLEEVGQNKLLNITKETGYDIEEVKAAVETIRNFNPKPGAAFSSGDDEIYVIPEVFIEKIGDNYVPRLNEQNIPTLRINNTYKEVILHKEQTQKETYDFIKNKLDDALAFLKFIDKRKDTIINVSKAICEVQHDFFEYGILKLKPLTLQDVAGMAGVHESTVSRATSGKFAQTPRGLLELKFFFSGAARTSGPEDVSTLSVKTRINELIKNENQRKPLSDSAIVALLKKEGITLARRTVAKYREELNIPSSSARKVL